MLQAPEINETGISEYQLYLFNEGTNFQSYEFLGVHKIDKGWRFAVWAPNAQAVYITGDFNGWDNTSHPMYKLGSTGVWVVILDCIKENDLCGHTV